MKGQPIANATKTKFIGEEHVSFVAGKLSKSCGNLSNPDLRCVRHHGINASSVTLPYKFARSHHMTYMDHDENRFASGITRKCYTTSAVRPSNRDRDGATRASPGSVRDRT